VNAAASSEAIALASGRQAAAGISGKTPLAGWLGISLLLHAALLLPFFLAPFLKLPAPSEQRLAVELFGMVSSRQTEAMQEGQKVDRAAVQPQKPQPRQQVQETRKFLQTTADSPVQVAKQEEAKPENSAPPQAVPRGEDVQQKQQMLNNVDPLLDAKLKYLAALKKAIKARLVYPQEARQAGQTGVTIISFRIGASGEIEAGTLAVRKSCGFSLLDENALNAARAAAPFAAPPAPMNVALDIAFSEEKK
jgi:periplasmic protein TonB